jgi:hypothetical protein
MFVIFSFLVYKKIIIYNIIKYKHIILKIIFLIFCFNLPKDSSVNTKGTSTNMYKLIAVTKTTPQQLLMKKVILNLLILKYFFDY